MWKVITETFEKPKEGGAYISGVTRFVPAHHKPMAIDWDKVDKKTANCIREAIKRRKGEVIRKGKMGEPIDYGINKSQFYSVLDKASQPTEEPKSDSGKAQT